MLAFIPGTFFNDFNADSYSKCKENCFYFIAKFLITILIKYHSLMDYFLFNFLLLRAMRTIVYSIALNSIRNFSVKFFQNYFFYS